MPACQLSTQTEGTEEAQETLKVPLILDLNCDLGVIRVLKRDFWWLLSFHPSSLLSGTPPSLTHPFSVMNLSQSQVGG